MARFYDRPYVIKDSDPDSPTSLALFLHMIHGEDWKTRAVRVEYQQKKEIEEGRIRP